MKKSAVILSVFALLSAALAGAQDFDRCYTTEMFRERVKNHPGILAVQRQLELVTRHPSVEALSGMQRTQGTVRIIPVVFHILHNYGPENISDAQVLDEVRILNEDFRMRNPDTVAIVPAFKHIAADCEIEFRLATIDPNGNCTNGIDRIVSTLTENAGDQSKLNPWPDHQYLNIWVVSSLAWSGVAAYAYYPGTAPAGADGVISQHRFIGSIGTGSPGTSRVITHEVGHCFNLTHVWGDTNDPGVSCGDDSVSDTPITEGWTSCNLNGSSCGNSLDNVQNYMEYAYCDRMFTQGQKYQDAGRSELTHRRTQQSLDVSQPRSYGNEWFGRRSLRSESRFHFQPSGRMRGKHRAVPRHVVERSSYQLVLVIPRRTAFHIHRFHAFWYSMFQQGTYSATLTAGNSTGSNTVTKTAVRVGGPPVNSIPTPKV
jgi:hypothetical protein